MSPVAISAECQSPDHYSVEIRTDTGEIVWVECTQVEPYRSDAEPSCPGGTLEEVGFVIENRDHADYLYVCYDAIFDALQGDC